MRPSSRWKAEKQKERAYGQSAPQIDQVVVGEYGRQVCQLEGRKHEDQRQHDQREATRCPRCEWMA